MRASIADPDDRSAPVPAGARPRRRPAGVDRQHRLAGAERQALRHRAGRAQAGEGAGAAAEGDRVEVGERRRRRSPSSAEDRRHQRRRGLRAARRLVRPTRPRAAQQRDAHALGRGVEGQQRRHRDSRGSGRCHERATPPDGAARRLRAMLELMRRVSRCDHRRWCAVLSQARAGACCCWPPQRPAPRPAAAGRAGAGSARTAARSAGRVWCRRSAATRAAPRLAGRPAGQSGLADQARHDLRRARPARPGLDLDHAGLAATAPRAPTACSTATSYQGQRRSEAGARAHLAAAAPGAAAGRARDPRRHRARPQRLRAAPSRTRRDFDGEPLRPYNVGADALLLNYKSLLLTFTPDPARGIAQRQRRAAAGRRARRCERAAARRGRCGDWRGALRRRLRRPAPRSASPAATRRPAAKSVWPVAYADPKSYNARALAGLWRELGGMLRGSVRDGAAPAGAPSFELRSPPLAEVVRDINKFSNNVMAQQLFLTLGAARSAAPARPRTAREVLRQWLARAPRRRGRAPRDRQRLGPVARRRASARGSSRGCCSRPGPAR